MVDQTFDQMEPQKGTLNATTTSDKDGTSNPKKWMTRMIIALMVICIVASVLLFTLMRGHSTSSNDSMKIEEGYLKNDASASG